MKPTLQQVEQKYLEVENLALQLMRLEMDESTHKIIEQQMDKAIHYEINCLCGSKSTSWSMQVLENIESHFRLLLKIWC